MSYPKQPTYPQLQTDSISAVVRSELLQAIDQNNVKACEELILSDPRRVNETGWNNLSPVHQVCLRGQMKILQLLLHHGASLDAKSSFGETPLHYACRRGDVKIIHLLIKAGSDLTAMDKQSRTCMHFAAIGGNIPAVHYLGTQTELTYDVVDDLGDSPLHIACTHRHTYLINYLLRHQRCDPKRQNGKGQTALHIAAEMGNSEIVWTLLKVAKCGIARSKDENDLTAVDVARKGATNRHKNIADDLEYYAKQDVNSEPEGPKLTWCVLISLPFLWAACVFILTSTWNSLSGIFSLLMFIFLILFVYRQSHRIQHAARWPNPVFLGAFSAGIFHCLIAAAFKIVFEFWPCPGLAMVILVLSSTSLYLMKYLVCGDPGYVRHPRNEDGRTMDVLDIASGRCKESDFCPYTEMIKPDRTKYCRLCEKLVVDLDHHCLFIANCVARHNHRAFVVFILNVIMLQVFFLYESYVYVTTFYPNSVMQPSVSLLFHYEPWLFSLSLLCLLSLLWESSLMFVQFRNIARSQTVYYSSHAHGPLTWPEAMKNILRFFLRPGKRRTPVQPF